MSDSVWFEGSRWCSSCRRHLPVESFSMSRVDLSGRQGKCKECSSAYHREWREHNRATVERYNAERRVGLHELVCANCGKSFTARQGNAKTCGKPCRDRLRYLRRKGWRREPDCSVWVQLSAARVCGSAVAAVRQVVLARDQGLCRLCGKGGRLAVAHAGNTSAMLERGEDVYDSSVLFSAHQRCHNQYAAGKLELLPIGTRR